MHEERALDLADALRLAKHLDVPGERPRRATEIAYVFPTRFGQLARAATCRTYSHEHG